MSIFYPHQLPAIIRIIPAPSVSPPHMSMSVAVETIGAESDINPRQTIFISSRLRPQMEI
jgi:hypothetical protein